MVCRWCRQPLAQKDFSIPAKFRSDLQKRKKTSGLSNYSSQKNPSGTFCGHSSQTLQTKGQTVFCPTEISVTVPQIFYNCESAAFYFCFGFFFILIHEMRGTFLKWFRTVNVKIASLVLNRKKAAQNCLKRQIFLYQHEAVCEEEQNKLANTKNKQTDKSVSTSKQRCFVATCVSAFHCANHLWLLTSVALFSFLLCVCLAVSCLVLFSFSSLSCSAFYHLSSVFFLWHLCRFLLLFFFLRLQLLPMRWREVSLFFSLCPLSLCFFHPSIPPSFPALSPVFPDIWYSAPVIERPVCSLCSVSAVHVIQSLDCHFAPFAALRVGVTMTLVTGLTAV